MKKIELIVPVYNEEESIFKFHKEVCDKLIPFCSEDIKIEIVFINDGSKDSTLTKIKELHSTTNNVSIINLSRNFGKENALFAGLEQSNADAVIPIDVDLQDPIELIPLMIEKWIEGSKVVLAKRSDRETDTYFKRKTAEVFYKFHNIISDTKIPENVGDYRLIDKMVVSEIKKLNESNLFMKGLFSWVGYYDETTMIEYKRSERIEGKTKFNAWKLLNLAVEGITSFSTFPLRIWSYIGFFMASISFLFGFKIIVDKLIFGNDIAGYPSLFVAITFIGGIQLIGLGVMGEYIGKIYNEVKNRPKYIIREKIEAKKD